VNNKRFITCLNLINTRIITYDLLRLIIHVVFPLLSTTKNEIEIFNQTPDDFVTLALDTCDK
jgi:hypothetical protein